MSIEITLDNDEFGTQTEIVIDPKEPDSQVKFWQKVAGGKWECVELSFDEFRKAAFEIAQVQKAEAA